MADGLLAGLCRVGGDRRDRLSTRVRRHLIGCRQGVISGSLTNQPRQSSQDERTRGHPSDPELNGVALAPVREGHRMVERNFSPAHRIPQLECALDDVLFQGIAEGAQHALNVKAAGRSIADVENDCTEILAVPRALSKRPRLLGNQNVPWGAQDCEIGVWDARSFAIVRLRNLHLADNSLPAWVSREETAGRDERTRLTDIIDENEPAGLEQAGGTFNVERCEFEIVVSVDEYEVGVNVLPCNLAVEGH